MILFGIYFLLMWGVMVILYKYNVKEFLVNVSVRINRRLFYDMSNCEFCIEHHVGVILCCIFGLFSGYELIMFIYPFMFASLSNVIKTIAKK